MNSLDKMEEEKMREADTAHYKYSVRTITGYESDEEGTLTLDQHSAICQILAGDLQHSAILEDYDRLAKLCEKQDKEIQELRNKLNEMTERHTS